MKRILLLHILLLFCLQNTWAQKPTIIWGKEEKQAPRTYIKKIICETEGIIYIYRTSGESLKRDVHIMETYSSENLNLLNRIFLPPLTDTDALVEDIKYIGHHLVVFYSVLDKANQRTAYAQLLSKSGNKTGEAIMLDQLSFAKKRNIGTFDFVLSADSSKILLYRNEPFEKYAQEKFSYRVFDKHFNLLWNKEMELPYTDKYFEITEYRIDNNGNVFMLATIFPDKNKGEKNIKGLPNHKHVLFAFYPNESELSEFEITLSGKFISDITFRLNDKNDLVVAGFYSNSGFYNINGTFYMLIDAASRDVKITKLKPFDRDFLLNFLSEKNADKGRGLSNIYFNHFILTNNGSAVLIGEQHYVENVCFNDMRTGNLICNYHFFYNDIIAVNIDSTGTITWANRIPKFQHTVNDNGFYSSYSLATVNNHLHFIFNDNPKNIELAETKPNRLRAMTGAQGAVTMLCSINANGETIREPLFSAKGGNVILRPKFFKQINPNELIIFAQRGKKYKLGKLCFQ